MDTESPAGQIARMLTGYWVSQMLYVAARLDLAGRLAAGPRTAEELAQGTGMHGPSLFRLLRGLAGLGVFAEVEPRTFANTPLSDALRDDVPGSQRAMALLTGEEHFLAWSQFFYCVHTGQTGFEKVFGQRPFDYLAQHPEQAANFDAAMTSVHGQETPAMLDAYDFSGISLLADVGGGNGSLLCATLARHPELRGLLYDLPHVVERTKSHVAAAGLTERCQCVSGSFFDSVPAGADAYLLRHILHDWDDAECKRILDNVRAAIGSQAARLLVLETVIPAGNDPMFGKLLDLNMLVVPGGQERTREEYAALFEAAGFRLQRIVPTRTEVSVIEAGPA